MFVFLRVACGLVGTLLFVGAIALLIRAVDGAGLAVMIPGSLYVLGPRLLLPMSATFAVGAVVLGAVALRRAT